MPKIYFAWYDFWIGFYWDRSDRALYVCLIPMIVIKFGGYKIPQISPQMIHHLALQFGVPMEPLPPYPRRWQVWRYWEWYSLRREYYRIRDQLMQYVKERQTGHWSMKESALGMTDDPS